MTPSNSKDQVFSYDEEISVELFDPLSLHFVSQNRRNDFVKALEDDREYTYDAGG